MSFQLPVSNLKTKDPNKKPELSSVSESSSLSPDTASIYLTHAPHVPSDESKTKSRLALIRAHRHYLEILYHKPLHLDFNKFPELWNRMIRVLRLADAYGSLAIFKMPIEIVFGQLRLDLDSLCSKYYFDIIYIATLARSAWLFQYVICRLVGDPTWTDDRISKTFETLGVVALVLEKRSQLRETMLRLDHTIMLAGLPVDESWNGIDATTLALATAAYKLHLLEHIKKHDRGGWKLSSEKYRVLKDEEDGFLNWDYDKVLFGFKLINNFNVIKQDFKAVIDHLRKFVGKQVSPLLIDHLDRNTLFLIWPHPKRKYQGLACVKITDDDLPWRDIPW